ncbi:MAG: CPBP family intramembrane metalloprotease [Faecalibacterium sp.]|nr:CPBP family intramembrane metalloprotease [Faecalibacterium sp.]
MNKRRPVLRKANRIAGLRQAALRCGLCTLVYLLARNLLSIAGNGVLQLWLGGPGVGAPLALWELAQWVVTLFSGAAALLVPVWALRQTVRPAALLGQHPRRGVLRLMLPVWLAASQLGSLAAGAVAQRTGTGQQITLPETWPALIPAFLALCVMPAVLEELLFRGVLQVLLRPWGAWLAIVGQAVLFGVLHGSLSAVVYAVLSGLFFGWLAEQSGSLWPGMVLHGINNSLSFAALLLRSRGYPWLAQGVLVGCAVVFPLWGLAALLAAGLRRRRVLRPIERGRSPAVLLRCPGWLLPVVGLLAVSLWQSPGG